MDNHAKRLKVLVVVLNGIQLLAKNMPAYIPGPISKIAKRQGWNGYELMEMGDLKLYAANMLVMMITMSDIEVILKILLLLITIGLYRI